MAFSPPTTNITSGVDFFGWINTSIDGWFFSGMLMAVYFVMLIRMLYNTEKTAQAFVSASFICLILSVLLRAADLISNVFMVIFIILTAIGSVWVHQEDAKFG